MNNDLHTITSIVLQNESINRGTARTIAHGIIKRNLEAVKNFVETYPSNEYAIGGMSAYNCKPLKAKSYKELNGTQRGNFNAIKKMVAQFAA